MNDAMVVDVSQDWATACAVQQRFMVCEVPASAGVRYSGRCRQLRALGGDCYDFLPLSPNHLGFAIADASGKSLPAALMIANVQSSLRTAAFFAGNQPGVALGAVNRQLHATSLADRFATLFYGVLDIGSRVLRYANAGHHPPLVIRRDGTVASFDTANLPLGIYTNSEYEEGVLRIDAGDRIIAYTDGVVEAVNPSGEEWGMEGVRKAALASKAHCPDELVDAIFSSLDEFSRGHQSDDATVIALVAN